MPQKLPEMSFLDFIDADNKIEVSESPSDDDFIASILEQQNSKSDEDTSLSPVTAEVSSMSLAMNYLIDLKSHENMQASFLYNYCKLKTRCF